MPRGKKQDEKKQDHDPNVGRKYYCAPDAVWGGYIDLRLDEDRRSAFDDWYLAPTFDREKLLQGLLVDGLSFSLKFDANASSFLATFTGAGVSGSNERYCLTARAGEADEATALLLYKHQVLLSGSWGDVLVRSGKLKAWG